MIKLRRRRSLTCQELVELVTDYLEEKLSRSDRDAFDAHLANCTNCRTYVDQFRRTIEVAGSLQESDVSPEAATVLLEQFGEWKRGRT
jgi:predicted anti-sigma-YlaC factor YlaD